jgi:hypothetical protein
MEPSQRGAATSSRRASQASSRAARKSANQVIAASRSMPVRGVMMIEIKRRIAARDPLIVECVFKGDCPFPRRYGEQDS